MKRLIFTFCLVLHLAAQAFSCDPPEWQSYCEFTAYFENVFSGRLAETFDNGVSIELLEVIKGSETRAKITVWDGETGDCNGTVSTAYTNHYGDVGDTLVFALLEPIQTVELEWDVAGDYRKPGNLFGFYDFKKINNKQVTVEDESYGFVDYTYDDFLTFLYSGDCLENVNERGGCEGVDDPLSLPWLVELIENTDACVAGSVEQFSYQDSEYIKVDPYYQFPYYECPADLPVKVYNCAGELVCTIGGYGQQLKHNFDECEPEFTEAAFNGTLLWTYSDTCTEPIEYEITTQPVCVGENLFAVGITIASEGNYTLGENYSGELISENFELETIIILRSDQSPHIINPTNSDTDCSTEDILIVAPYCENAENSCTIEDPINNLPWLQDIIDEYPNYDCEDIDNYPEYKIYYFCNHELGLFYLTPAPAFEAGQTYLYDVTGNLICTYGGLVPNVCSFEWLDDFDENGKEIWPCAAYCEEPSQLEVVQNAIDGGCAELIFTFIDEGQQYVFIDKTCEGNGVVYNCTTQTSCTYNTIPSLQEKCNLYPAVIGNSFAEENIIWSKPCNYEYEGTVRSQWFSCGPACDGIIFYIELEDGTNIYPLQDIVNINLTNKRVRFSYAELTNLMFDLLPGYPVPINPIICIEEIIENNCEDPLQLEIVQNAMEDECVAAVYALNYQSQSYVYIDQLCENFDGDDILYNCNTNETCIIGDLAGLIDIGEICEALFYELEYLLTEENIIWRPGVEPNSSLFETYSWLNNIVNPETCNGGTSITVYDYPGSYYTFLHITESNGDASLYFQDGTFYCSDAPGYSCIEAYDLTQMPDSWACGNPIMPPNENELFEQYNWLNNYINPKDCSAFNKVTEYDLGPYSFLYIEDSNGGKLYFEDGTFYCASAPGYNCVELYGLNNPTTSWACENPVGNCLVDDPFSLSWFQELVSVDAELGIPGILWYADHYYPAAIYEIWQFEFEGDTYFNALYGVIGPAVDIIGTAIFDCSGNLICYSHYTDSEPVCQYSLNNEYEDELIWANRNPYDVFSNYIWLNTLIDQDNCQGTSIKVYAYGTYDFISIENNEGTSLYFQDGTFYCSDAPNYNCVELYRLNESVNEWNCTGIIQKQAAAIVNQKIAFDVDFKTYPNPSNGRFTVEFAENNPAGLVNIISITGDLIKTINIEANQKQITVDLTEVAKGIYIIQLETGNNTKTQRMIIR